jgi:small-conductance mechanosensitive channel
MAKAAAIGFSAVIVAILGFALIAWFFMLLLGAVSTEVPVVPALSYEISAALLALIILVGQAFNPHTNN